MTISEVSPPALATISHSFHKKHELSQVTTPGPGFICNGCKQFGQGPRHYRCEPCDFDLHAHCATAPAVLHHPLFAGKKFDLYKKHATKAANMACRACGGEALGFRYYNSELKLYLHPCCTLLPTRVLQDGRAFELCNEASSLCGICSKKSQSWSYRSNYNDGEHVYMHVPCLLDGYNKVVGVNKWQPTAPILQGVVGIIPRKKIDGGALFQIPGINGGALLQAAGTAFNVLGLVYHVVTLDPAGIAESAQKLMGGFE